MTVCILLFLSASSFVVLAQYATQQKINVTIPANGIATIDQSSTVGAVSIVICGTCGATASVSTETYVDNPQPDASIPTNVALTHFVAVTFDMSASDFQSANITIHYSSSDVSGVSPPFVLYKYNANSNTYVALTSVTDTSAQTITTTVTNINDPLLAIGSATSSRTGGSGIPSWTWVVVATVIAVIVVIAVLMLTRRRSSFIKLA